jgi:uncharacterized protein (DUF2267 family)
MNSDFQTLEISEVDFLYHIKKEFSFESSHEAVSVVASVLQTLRQTLPLDSADKLLNQLPDFLKLVFAANWKRDESQISVQHLDEFVCLMMKREQKSHKSYFNNEVQALSITVLTLKLLNKLVNLDTLEGLSNNLLQELRDIPAEVAA